MKDEELKEVTVKEKLDKYKLGLQKVAVGLGLMAVSGIGGPIVGNYLCNDPAFFGTIAMVTVPITGVTAAMFGVKLKKYFEMKKDAGAVELLQGAENRIG